MDLQFTANEMYVRGNAFVVSGTVSRDDVTLSKQRVNLNVIEVLWIVLDEELTNNQKRAQLRDLFIEAIQRIRIPEAYDAVAAVRELIGEPPITITFEPAPLPEPPDYFNGGGESFAVSGSDMSFAAPTLAVTPSLESEVASLKAELLVQRREIDERRERAEARRDKMAMRVKELEHTQTVLETELRQWRESAATDAPVPEPTYELPTRWQRFTARVSAAVANLKDRLNV